MINISYNLRNTFAMNFKRVAVILAYLLFISAFACTVFLMLYIDFSFLPGDIKKSLPKFLDKTNNGSTDRLDLDVSASFNNASSLIDFKDLGSNKKNVLLLIIVSTAPQRFDRRQAIRETWWKHCAESQVQCVFITDGLTEDEAQRTLMQQERNTYRDLEFQPLQGGREFGLRFLYHIKWAMAKFNFRYLLRIDDDYFLCLKRLLFELPTRPNKTLVWGNFHCDGGITWIDESFMIFTQDIIHEFLSQNESTMLCHPHADQQVGLWLKHIPTKQYFHDRRLYHDPPASFSREFNNISNVCNSYLGLHGTYVEKMRYFGRNSNDGIKSVVPIQNFSIFCPTTHFDHRVFSSPYFFELKPCMDNPTWNLTSEMYVGREND